MVKSHPTRVRGLKLRHSPLAIPQAYVAPHAGAWIETVVKAHARRGALVAPHAGAWIETLYGGLDVHP